MLLPPLRWLALLVLGLLARAGRPGGVLPPPRDPGVVSALGWQGVGSFFQTFGFLEVGAVTLPDPVQRLSVHPLACLEGQGR